MDSAFMQEKLNRFRWLPACAAGFVILLSLWFLGAQAARVWGRLPEFWGSSSAWGLSVFAAVFYGLILSILSRAWWSVLRLLYPSKVPMFREIFRVYMRTQIAKYIPGNVFHYVGRAEMLKHSGFTRVETALSLTYESALLILAASALGGVSALGIGAIGSAGTGDARWWGIGAGMGLLMLALWGVHHWRPGPLRHLPGPGQMKWTIILRVLAMYGSFFCLFSAILWVVSSHLGNALPYVGCLTVICIPWVIGFVTPGAPGGLGVREAMMVLILNQFVSPLDSLLLATLMRMVTVIGDLVAFAFSYVPGFFRA